MVPLELLCLQGLKQLDGDPLDLLDVAGSEGRFLQQVDSYDSWLGRPASDVIWAPQAKENHTMPAMRTEYRETREYLTTTIGA